jgi:hypothetical protein
MTADPVSPLRPSRRRPQRSGPGKVVRLHPHFGIVEEADQGAWTARTFGGVELGTYRHRGEAAEALVVFGT